MDDRPLLYSWSAKLALGVPQVDEDHRLFIDILNELWAATVCGLPGEQVAGTARHLVAYAIRHFSAEERFFREVGYPGYAEHRQQHVWYVGRLRAAASGPRDSAAEALGFMRDWLFGHIAGADRRYVAWTQANVRGPASRYAGVTWALRPQRAALPAGTPRAVAR